MPFDLSIDSDAATVLDMSDADLAEVAGSIVNSAVQSITVPGYTSTGSNSD